MSLISRVLEQNGIATVIVGSAKDIVEMCGVARFLFTDYPLGNPMGKPYDREMQERNLRQGLEMLETVVSPGTTWLSPFHWDTSLDWKQKYMEIREEDRELLRAKGEERRNQRQSRRSTQTK